MVVFHRQGDILAPHPFEFHLGIVCTTQVHGQGLVLVKEFPVFLFILFLVSFANSESLSYSRYAVVEIILALEEPFVVVLSYPSLSVTLSLMQYFRRRCIKRWYCFVLHPLLYIQCVNQSSLKYPSLKG